MAFVKTSCDAEAFSTRTPTAAACVRMQDLSSGGRKRVIEKRFEVDFVLTPVQQRIIHRMAEFYDDELIDQVLRPVIEQQGDAPSIRAIDWFLTNFSKSRRVVCKQKDGETLDVFMAYKRVLNHYRRRNFDAFRRKLRVTVLHPAGPLVTTIAQLNFYAWAHATGVLEWCRLHIREIENDMNHVSAASKSRRAQRQPGERRRTELSHAAKAKVAIYEAA
jgi:hypothetical protein